MEPPLHREAAVVMLTVFPPESSGCEERALKAIPVACGARFFNKQPLQLSKQQRRKPEANAMGTL
jgi:hypothetical protein